MTELPKMLVVLGAPDTLAAATPQERRGNLRLPGNSGLVSALVNALRARAAPPVVAIAWPDGDTEGQRLVEEHGVEVLVNGVCEPLSQRGALAQVARLEAETGLPTINPSRVIAPTARHRMARRVGRREGVRAPHCTLYEAGSAGTLVEHVRDAGHRYPVLLRPAGSHGSIGLVRAADDTDVAAAAGALGTCSVTDFVDFRSEDGLWRKHRIVYAGGKLFRRHLLVDQQWNVVGDSRYFMHERGLFDEEREWLARPFDADPIAPILRAQFEAMELDFGAIDYALLPDGELVIFEINACVQVTGTIPEQHRAQIGYIEENNDEILDALLQRVRSRAAAGAAARPG